MSTHHTLDIHHIREKVLCINEPKFSDQAALNYENIHKLEDQSEKYPCLCSSVLNNVTILRRLQDIYYHYGYLTEAKESLIRQEVSILIF